MTEGTVLDQLPEALARAESLPSLPTVAVEILRLSSDEGASIEDLAEVISRDPALSVKVLKLANSALFRRGEAVTSLDMATMRLGMKTVKLMALSFSLTGDLSRKGETRGFDYLEFWRRSLTMAVAGRSMARLVKNPNGDEAFLCGLLGRIGQLVMAQCIPERYAGVIESAEGELPGAALESEALGFDFHQVGCALLGTWELPALIHQTVRFWGSPEEIPEETDPGIRELTRIMHLASHTTAVLCGTRKGTALHALHRLSLEFFGISGDEVDAFVVSLESDVSEAAALLNVDVDSGSYHGIIDQARAEMVQVSLGTAIDLRESVTRTEELEKENQQLESLASTDKLTGIPNRAHFDQVLERVIEARLTGKSRNPLGLLIVDVDHFKKFNDTYGHLVGDEVLKGVAARLASAVRDTDTVARYGGEEFAAIVPNATRAELESVAERVRLGIGQEPFDCEGKPLEVTVSVGGASVPRVRSPKDGTALLSLADRCLYQAKDAGRNRSVCRELGSESPD